MIQKVVRDVMFLGRKSLPAEKSDLPIALDLRDTLLANRARCVGMAANMIGSLKRIIAVSVSGTIVIMINPVIVQKERPYETEEGCLSLEGMRKTKRYQNIRVEYLDMNWKKHRGSYSEFEAQIIQHEMDHLEGIVI